MVEIIARPLRVGVFHFDPQEGLAERTTQSELHPFATLGDDLDRPFERLKNEDVMESVFQLARGEIPFLIEGQPLIGPLGEVGVKVDRPIWTLVVVNLATIPTQFFFEVVVANTLCQDLTAEVGDFERSFGKTVPAVGKLSATQGLGTGEACGLVEGFRYFEISPEGLVME